MNDEPAGETGSHHDRDVDRRVSTATLLVGGGDELLRLAKARLKTIEAHLRASIEERAAGW